MDTAAKLCPCCTDKEYSNCCETYHKGALPESALLLMRSRYSAYALNLPEYIIMTTHPESNLYLQNKETWKKQISQFSTDTIFQRLDIHNFKEKSDTALVTFTAYLLEKRKDATFTERSSFKKLGERWLFLNGQTAPGYSPEIALID